MKSQLKICSLSRMNLATLLNLISLLILFMGINSVGQIPISHFPVSSVTVAGDDIIINRTNTGLGTWTTERINIAALLASPVVTNTIVSQSLFAASTNNFVLTNDARALNLSYLTNIMRVANLFLNATNAISTNVGSIAFTNGTLVSPDDVNLLIFYNRSHATDFNGTGEWQITGNQFYIGPANGNHIQIGLASDTRGDALIMQFFYPTNRTTNASAHAFGYHIEATNGGTGFWHQYPYVWSDSTMGSQVSFDMPAATNQNWITPSGIHTMVWDSDQGVEMPGYSRNGFAVPSSATTMLVNITNEDLEFDLTGNTTFVETNFNIQNHYSNSITLHKILLLYNSFNTTLTMTFPANWVWLGPLPQSTNYQTNAGPVLLSPYTVCRIDYAATVTSTATNRLVLPSFAQWTNGIDPDAENFINTLPITDVPTQQALNTLAISAKRHGYWTKLIALYPMVGGNSNGISYNMINPLNYRISFTGSWTFNANGMTGDGSTAGAICTSLIPSTIGSFSQTNTFCGIWTRGSNPNNSWLWSSGAFVGGAAWGGVFTSPNISMRGMNNGTAGGALSYSSGFNGQSRTGSTTETDIHGGIIQDITGLSATTGLPTHEASILSRWDGSGFDQFSTGNADGYFVGQGFSDQNLSDLMTDYAVFNGALSR